MWCKNPSFKCESMCKQLCWNHRVSHPNSNLAKAELQLHFSKNFFSAAVPLKRPVSFPMRPAWLRQCYYYRAAQQTALGSWSSWGALGSRRKDTPRVSPVPLLPPASLRAGSKTEGAASRQGQTAGTQRGSLSQWCCQSPRDGGAPNVIADRPRTVSHQP